MKEVAGNKKIVCWDREDFCSFTDGYRLSMIWLITLWRVISFWVMLVCPLTSY